MYVLMERVSGHSVPITVVLSVVPLLYIFADLVFLFYRSFEVIFLGQVNKKGVAGIVGGGELGRVDAPCGF